MDRGRAAHRALPPGGRGSGARTEGTASVDTGAAQETVDLAAAETTAQEADTIVRSFRVV